MIESEALGLCELAQKANQQRALEKGQQTALRALIDSLKYPVWLKDEESRMVVINKAYERKFGISAEEYEGKTDFEVWDKETAEQFRKNDLEALDKFSHLETFEVVPTTKGPEELYIIKTALKIDGKRYIKGEAIKVDDMRLIVRICDG